MGPRVDPLVLFFHISRSFRGLRTKTYGQVRANHNGVVLRVGPTEDWYITLTITRIMMTSVSKCIWLRVKEGPSILICGA